MITGDDFIQLASRWSLLDGEATWRSSISRAYYGAFHSAQTFLFDDLQIAPPQSGKNRHSFVHNALMASGNAQGRKAGSMLQSLHEHRKNADYDLARDEAGRQELAIYAVESAAAIRKLLHDCNEETAKRQIATEVLQWRTRTRQ
jgi:uncharacterized protein (UPF0332 family)